MQRLTLQSKIAKKVSHFRQEVFYAQISANAAARVEKRLNPWFKK